MQHPLSKPPIFVLKIGGFVACGRVIKREGGLRTGPLHTSPAKAFVQFFQFPLLFNRPFSYTLRVHSVTSRPGIIQISWNRRIFQALSSSAVPNTARASIISRPKMPPIR